MATGNNLDRCKKDFGENLVFLRKAKGLNQKEFAQALDISPTRLNYWEKGTETLFDYKKIGVIPSEPTVGIPEDFW